LDLRGPTSKGKGGQERGKEGRGKGERRSEKGRRRTGGEGERKRERVDPLKDFVK